MTVVIKAGDNMPVSFRQTADDNYMDYMWRKRMENYSVLWYRCPK